MVKPWFCLAAIALLVGISGITSAQSRPNVIVIISDDAGYADFGFMDGLSGETSEIPTPNLDALAARGIKFSRSYVAANCQPTRAAIVTGGYQQRIGNESVGNNLFYAVDDPRIQTDGFEGVPVETATIWDRMKGLGYSTAALGKWHLGQHADSADGQVLGNRPQNQGVDYFYGFWHGDRKYDLTRPYGDAQTTRLLRETTVAADGTINDRIAERDDDRADWLTDQLANKAIDFIKDQQSKSQPFFLYQAFGAPHKVWDESPDYNDPRIAKLTGNRKLVGGMMITMDKAIGRILATLDDPNGDGNMSDSIADNTLVVFVNDNGGVNSNPAGTDNGALRAWKGSAFEGGIRVPMIMAGAGIDASKQGTTYASPVHGIDILPTAVALGGGTLGPGEDEIDGVNLLPHLNGAEAADPHEVLVHRWRGNFAVIKGDWKLINRRNWNSDPSHYELYNVATDMSETTDVIGDMPEMASQMIRDLTDHEAFFDKPRYAIKNNTVESQPINIFDHFVFRPGVHDDWSGGGNFDNDLKEYVTVARNWLQAGTNIQEAMLGTDAFPGAIVEFPVANASYISNNDLTRQTGLEFMLNKIILSGSFAGADNPSATIGGKELLFTGDLQGVGPQIAVDANNSGSGSFSYNIDLDLILYDDLAVTGDGDTQVDIHGDIRDYFEPRSLTKRGSSKVTLHGNNTYKGDTKVEAGTLSINDAYLEDGANVYLTAGATFDLNFVGNDVVNALFIDGAAQPTGTWGALGSNADHESPLLTGSGLLLVSTLAALPGDFNNDGVVDLADYTVWRDNLGAPASTLANDVDGGTVGSAQYNTWKAHFGTSAASAGAQTSAVPKPPWALLLVLAGACAYRWGPSAGRIAHRACD